MIYFFPICCKLVSFSFSATSFTYIYCPDIHWESLRKHSTVMQTRAIANRSNSLFSCFWKFLYSKFFLPKGEERRGEGPLYVSAYNINNTEQQAASKVDLGSKSWTGLFGTMSRDIPVEVNLDESQSESL